MITIAIFSKIIPKWKGLRGGSEFPSNLLSWRSNFPQGEHLSSFLPIFNYLSDKWFSSISKTVTKMFVFQGQKMYPNSHPCLVCICQEGRSETVHQYVWSSFHKDHPKNCWLTIQLTIDQQYSGWTGQLEAPMCQPIDCGLQLAGDKVALSHLQLFTLIPNVCEFEVISKRTDMTIRFPITR